MNGEQSVSTHTWVLACSDRVLSSKDGALSDLWTPEALSFSVIDPALPHRPMVYFPSNGALYVMGRFVGSFPNKQPFFFRRHYMTIGQDEGTVVHEDVELHFGLKDVVEIVWRDGEYDLGTLSIREAK